MRGGFSAVAIQHVSTAGFRGKGSAIHWPHSYGLRSLMAVLKMLLRHSSTESFIGIRSDCLAKTANVLIVMVREMAAYR